MFRILKLYKNTISIPLTGIIYLCIAFMCVFNNVVYTDVLYGMENAESISEINLKVLAEWILILFLPHIMNGIILERCNAIQIYSYVRTRSMALYYRNVHLICLMNSLLWGIILSSVHLCYDRKYSRELFIVLIPHIIMWTSVMLFSYFITKKATISFVFAPLICVASIGAACGNERLSNFSISSIGMLTKGNIFNDNGLSPVSQAVINVVISLVFIMANCIIGKFRGGEV